MPCFLGIDTSNYTTSCAIYDSENDTITHRKKLLPVKKGELGLRQSDAVFHHTVQLPELMKELFADFDGEIDAIGVSDAPMRAEGSYMPCFLTGVCAAESIAAATGKPLYRFSHQQGHIMAALFSSGRRELYGKDFFAFHVSGGTTQLECKVSFSSRPAFQLASTTPPPRTHKPLKLPSFQTAGRAGKTSINPCWL